MISGVQLRCDGSTKIGFGHIYRMIALYNLLEKNFRCRLIVQNPGNELVELLALNKLQFQILQDKDLNIAGVNVSMDHPITNNDILVLDGYHFNTEYQKSIKDNIGCKLVSVDDINAYSFLSDLVINHSGGIDRKNYRVQSDSRLVLGPEYAILRKEFYSAAAGFVRTNEVINHVFVNFGGSDPTNVTCKVLNDLLNLSLKIMQISVVVGPGFVNLEELKQIATKDSSVAIYSNLGPAEMIELIKKADLGICSASTIAYEFCSISGPLAVIQTADNQTGVYDFLICEKLALPYNNAADLIESALEISEILIANQRRYFDGRAGRRLQIEFTKLFLKDNCVLREANWQDVDLLFKWANDKEVRNHSFNSDPIEYDTHRKWYESQIGSSNNSIYIFESTQGVPLGNIRFKKEGTTAVLSYLIDEMFRGLNLGISLLNLGTDLFFKKNHSVDKVVGFVKDNNVASIKAFNRSNFQEEAWSEPNVRCFSKTSSYERSL